MALTARRAASALWPPALLAIFLGTYRRTVDGGAVAETPASCEGGAQVRDIARLERCLSLDPGDVGLMTDLGVAYEAAGRADRAEALYRRALSVDPRDGDVHVRLGRLLLARGDRDAARAEGEQAARWQPGARAPRDLIAQAGDSR